jgi:hypothetical protein
MSLPKALPRRIHVRKIFISFRGGKFNAIIIFGLEVRRHSLRFLSFLVPPPGSNHKKRKREGKDKP